MHLSHAFPSALRDDVAAVLSVLPPAKIRPTAQNIGDMRFGGEIRIGGKRIHIPARIYAPEPAEETTQYFTPRQRLILHCIYTRHHDGFVRERHLASIITISEPWIAPYVVQLLGEYVAGFGRMVLDAADSIDTGVYRQFGRENPGFIALTRQRAISYWNEYHRRRIVRLTDYPPVLAMQALGLWQADRSRQPSARRLV